MNSQHGGFPHSFSNWSALHTVGPIIRVAIHLAGSRSRHSAKHLRDLVLAITTSFVAGTIIPISRWRNESRGPFQGISAKAKQSQVLGAVL